MSFKPNVVSTWQQDHFEKHFDALVFFLKLSDRFGNSCVILSIQCFKVIYGMDEDMQ